MSIVSKAVASPIMEFAKLWIVAYVRCACGGQLKLKKKNLVLRTFGIWT